MRFGLLGPVLLIDDEDRIQSVPPGGQRLILAVLLLHANRPVTLDRLAELAWDGRPPPGHRPILRAYVARLRTSMGACGRRIATVPTGYVLFVEPGELDVTRFEEKLRRGLLRMRGGDWPGAATELAEGLSLWRGDPLRDVGCAELHRAEVPRLQRLREQALDALLAAETRSDRRQESLPHGRVRQVMPTVRR